MLYFPENSRKKRKGTIEIGKGKLLEGLIRVGRGETLERRGGEISCGQYFQYILL